MGLHQQRELKHAGSACRAAGVTLALGLLAFVLAPAVAFADLADSPHVVPTADTSICAACHSAHTAIGPQLIRTAAEQTGPSEACWGCHSGGDSGATNVLTGHEDSFDLPSGHVASSATSATASAAVTGCISCHDAHGAATVTREIPQKSINGVTVSSAGKELCLACHDDKNSWYGPCYPATAEPSYDATGYPVSGTWPGPSTYESPSNPHDQIPATTQTVGVSDPVRREQGDCLYCHAAHGGPNEYDGLVATFTVPTASTVASDQVDGSYAALCFECHGGSKPSGFATDMVDIKQFVTAGGLGGHSIVTTGGILPVGAPIPCFECHNPHGSKRGNASLISDERGGSLETSTAAGTREFCLTCHTTSDTGAGWDSDDATYTPVGATETLLGLPRDGADLRLMLHDGHSQDDTQSCGDCHGDSYDTGGHNVHNPSDGSVEATLVASDPTTDSVVASGTPDLTSVLDGSSASDTVPPLTASDATATYDTSATITLTAVDNDGGSGVAATYWSLDGAATATGTVVTTSDVGTHTLTFWSVDNAGNAETPTTVTFTVTDAQPSPPAPDQTPPPPAPDPTPAPTPDQGSTPTPDPNASSTPTSIVLQRWDYSSWPGAPSA